VLKLGKEMSLVGGSERARVGSSLSERWAASTLTIHILSKIVVMEKLSMERNPA